MPSLSGAFDIRHLSIFLGITSGEIRVCLLGPTEGYKEPLHLQIRSPPNPRCLTPSPETKQAVAYEYNTEFSRVMAERAAHFSNPASDAIVNMQVEVEVEVECRLLLSPRGHWGLSGWYP